MKLKGQMGECPRRFLKFLRKIRAAVTVTRSVFLTWASMYSCKQLIFQIYILGKSMSFRYFAISFRDFVVSWFTNSQTELTARMKGCETGEGANALRNPVMST